MQACGGDPATFLANQTVDEAVPDCTLVDAAVPACQIPFQDFEQMDQERVIVNEQRRAEILCSRSTLVSKRESRSATYRAGRRHEHLLCARRDARDTLPTRQSTRLPTIACPSALFLQMSGRMHSLRVVMLQQGRRRTSRNTHAVSDV